LIRDDLNREALYAIVTHYCWENKHWTEEFLAIFTEGLSKARSDRFSPFLHFFANMVDIEDSMQAWRVTMGLEFYLKVIQKSMSKSGVEDSINWLVKMANTRPLFRKKLFKNRSKINDVIVPLGYRVVDH